MKRFEFIDKVFECKRVVDNKLNVTVDVNRILTEDSYNDEISSTYSICIYDLVDILNEFEDRIAMLEQ